MRKSEATVHLKTRHFDNLDLAVIISVYAGQYQSVSLCSNTPQRTRTERYTSILTVLYCLAYTAADDDS